MDLRQLEIFVKVAELKSFSKAAQALRLTQPTISEHIRTLEQELGVRLLDRLGRGAEATRAGQLLLSHATRMLQLQRETLQAMDSFQGRLAGDLHVAASTIPGEYVLPALIGRFKEIGRASCRERVEASTDAVTLYKRCTWSGRLLNVSRT